MAYSEGEAVFFKKVRATLKYGLHWDAVISRWACEHANEVGALDVTKKSDIYISLFYISIPIFELDTIYNNTKTHIKKHLKTHPKRRRKRQKKERHPGWSVSLDYCLVINYLLNANATLTAHATVHPTIGLLPIPRKPIIST